MSERVSPRNGRCPDSSSCRTHPNAKMSARGRPAGPAPAPAPCTPPCHDRPRLRGRRAHRELVGAVGAGARELGDTEVEDLHAPVGRDEDVVGLEVAVDDPLSWAAARPRAIWTPKSSALRAGRAPPERRPALAFEQFGDRDTARRHTRRRRRARGCSGGKRGHGPRLVLEAPRRSGSAASRPAALDRDVAPEPRVARAVHLTHAARAEGADDLTRTETKTCGPCRSGSLRKSFRRCCRVRLTDVNRPQVLLVPVQVHPLDVLFIAGERVVAVERLESGFFWSGRVGRGPAEDLLAEVVRATVHHQDRHRGMWRAKPARSQSSAGMP